MDDNYWNDRYLKNQTGWDIGAAAPSLMDYLNQLKNKSISILIPGCGNAHEALFLIKNGFTNITLLDIAPELVSRLAEKFKAHIPAPLKIINQNFFEHKEKYDLIIEQTFFCALLPSLRKAYVTQMQELLNPGGKLVGLLFNRAFEGGPPFGGNEKEYRDLLEEKFTIKTMASAYNSIEPRKATELFFIAVNDKY